VLGHAADRLGRQRILGVLHLALGILFLTLRIPTMSPADSEMMSPGVPR